MDERLPNLELMIGSGANLKQAWGDSTMIVALKRLASASAIMQKFVDKVDRGMARSTETYAEMTEWLKEN